MHRGWVVAAFLGCGCRATPPLQARDAAPLAPPAPSPRTAPVVAWSVVADFGDADVTVAESSGANLVIVEAKGSERWILVDRDGLRDLPPPPRDVPGYRLETVWAAGDYPRTPFSCLVRNRRTGDGFTPFRRTLLFRLRDRTWTTSPVPEDARGLAALDDGSVLTLTGGFDDTCPQRTHDGTCTQVADERAFALKHPTHLVVVSGTARTVTPRPPDGGVALHYDYALAGVAGGVWIFGRGDESWSWAHLWRAGADGGTSGSPIARPDLPGCYRPGADFLREHPFLATDAHGTSVYYAGSCAGDQVPFVSRLSVGAWSLVPLAAHGGVVGFGVGEDDVLWAMIGGGAVWMRSAGQDFHEVTLHAAADGGALEPTHLFAASGAVFVLGRVGSRSLLVRLARDGAAEHRP